MNILVVGGAGYIGSHTLMQLHLQGGHNLVVLDDLSKGHREALEAISQDIVFYQGDLGDQALLREILQKHQIEAVMHFAALIEVGSSVSDPSTYYMNNFIKVQNLLDAMRKENVKFFVFSSTAATFGEPRAELISEEHVQEPINPYGRSKLMVEWLLKDYDQAYGLKSVILRYFNACGADEGGKIGQSYHPATHLVSIVLETALGKRPKVGIYGEDWPTADGSCVRDFIHVNDLAQAHLLALDRMVKTGSSLEYNLGNGSGYSVKEVIAMAKEVTGIDFTVESSPRRAGDPAFLIADSQKAKRELGWEPSRDLRAIIETAWFWEQKHSY